MFFKDELRYGCSLQFTHGVGQQQAVAQRQVSALQVAQLALQ